MIPSMVEFASISFGKSSPVAIVPNTLYCLPVTFLFAPVADPYSIVVFSFDLFSIVKFSSVYSTNFIDVTLTV
ncbi:hypothetical protein D3C74_419110 [compost metagenome]